MSAYDLAEGSGKESEADGSVRPDGPHEKEARKARRTSPFQTLKGIISRSDAVFEDLPDVIPTKKNGGFWKNHGEPPRRSLTLADQKPLTVAIGWIDSADVRDAVETAKGYAETHLNAPGNAHYHVEGNPGQIGGFFWEIQEGGPRRAYLPNIVRALAAGRGSVWVRVKDRAHLVSQGTGKPFTALIDEEQSQIYFLQTGNEIRPSTTRMTPVVWKGGALLTTGVFTALTGAAFYAAASIFAMHQYNTIPEPPKMDAGSLPSRQWQAIAHVPLDHYVEALRYSNGKWLTPTTRPIERYRSIDSIDPERRMAPPTATQPGPAAQPATAPARPGLAPTARRTPPRPPAGGPPVHAPPPSSLPDLNRVLQPPGH